MSDDAPRRCLACEHAAHPYGPCPTWIKSGDTANRCGCAPPAPPPTRCDVACDHCGQRGQPVRSTLADGSAWWRCAGGCRSDLESVGPGTLAYMMTLGAELGDQDARIAALVAELTALRAVQEAAERYMEHGRHAAPCAIYLNARCDCGFDALRTALARPASGETEPAASSDPNPEGNRRE